MNASFTLQSAELSTDCTPQEIIATLTAVGFEPSACVNIQSSETPFDSLPECNPHHYLKKSLIAALFGLPLMILEMLSLIPGPTMLIGQLILGALSLISVGIMLYSGWDIYKDAFLKLRKRQSNMNTLVTLGSLFSFIYALLLIAAPMALPMAGGMHLSLCAGVLILAIVNFGSYVKERARKKVIAHLPTLREEYLERQVKTVHRIHNDNSSHEIDFRDIRKGDCIAVTPGHYFPVNGSIIKTSNSIIHVDERSLNGELTPRPLSIGDAVYSGTRLIATPSADSLPEALIIQASCDGLEGSFHTRMLKIAHGMILDGEHTLIDQAVRWFTPLIIGIALLATALWIFVGAAPSFGLMAFLAILLCACPCALGLAAPLAYSTSVGRAFKHNILIGKSSALDTVAQAQIIALDMTGTLTTGEIEFVDSGCDTILLQKIASLEKASHSTHPLARAVLTENVLDLLNSNTIVKSSKGISGIIEEEKIIIGSADWMSEHSISINPTFSAQLQSLAEQAMIQKKVLISAYVAINNQLVGLITATQALREGVVETMASLKNEGLSTVLLTGGSAETAAMIAKHLGITKFKANSTPQAKKEYLEALKGSIVMVGDDANDIEALNAPNVAGICIDPKAPAAAFAAINLSGSMNDLLKLRHIAQATRKNIKINLALTLIYNVFSIALAAGAFFFISGVMLNPILAAALMALSSLTVVASALSLNYFIEKKFDPTLKLWKYIGDHWKKTCSINKFLYVFLAVSALLLMSTVIANVALGFSWSVIFYSMILTCTCCTGAIGILSAVGFIGVGLSVLMLGVKLGYAYYVTMGLTPTPSKSGQAQGLPLQKTPSFVGADTRHARTQYPTTEIDQTYVIAISPSQ